MDWISSPIFQFVQNLKKSRKLKKNAFYASNVDVFFYKICIFSRVGFEFQINIAMKKKVQVWHLLQTETNQLLYFEFGRYKHILYIPNTEILTRILKLLVLVSKLSHQFFMIQTKILNRERMKSFFSFVLCSQRNLMQYFQTKYSNDFLLHLVWN